MDFFVHPDLHETVLWVRLLDFPEVLLQISDPDKLLLPFLLCNNIQLQKSHNSLYTIHPEGSVEVILRIPASSETIPAIEPVA